MSEETILDAFRKQASFCRGLGSELTARVIEAAAIVLDHTTTTGHAILNWSGAPLADALPLRLAGGLHAVERAGKDPALSALYVARDGDFEAVVRRALQDWDHMLYVWLDSPPQTNEVGRSGALMAGLMVAADRLKLPIELLELGASAGLNQNLDRFHYRFGSVEAGPVDSPVRITPAWTGPPPPKAWPEIVARAAVDQNPLDPTRDDVAERLIAYVWPDQTERLARIEAAIAIARAFPPRVEAGDAADWIAARLRVPQAEGTARIVMHSVFWQYVPKSGQDRIRAAILHAGNAATRSRPLAWLRFEPRAMVASMQLELQIWPGGETLHLADCHPHGTEITSLMSQA